MIVRVYPRRPEDEKPMFLKSVASYLSANFDRQPVEGTGACAEAM